MQGHAGDVVEGLDALGKAFDLFEQALDSRARGDGAEPLRQGRQALLAELLAVCVDRLRHAVGEDQEGIARREVDHGLLVGHARDDAQRRTARA